MKNCLVYINIILLLGSCKTQNMFDKSNKHSVELDSIFVFDSAYQYSIRKDDKINLSVWGQDELSVGSVYGIYNSNEAYGKWLLVDANGNIEIPKIGTMNVLNKTVPELKDTLKLMLSHWVVNPVVDVKVLNKEITVVGEVRSPASVHMDEDRMFLLDVIAKTEGYEFYANLKQVKVIRKQGSEVKIANINLTRSNDYVNRNIQLHAGDVVVITSKHHKEFDKRIATIIPVASTITSLAILIGLFH
jgi:polysaccharide biosynthesis/export protein